jgi:CHAT domain-containing protein/Tfp pilus assembly protein PilF
MLGLNCSRFCARSLFCLLALALLTATVAAQSDQETKRNQAKRLLNDGFELRTEGSKESLQAALSKFEEAQPLFHSLNDTLNEAYVLLAIGRTYGDLGEYQKDVDYSTQALTLYRGAGDRKSEAVTLNNIAVVHYQLGDRQKALDFFGQALALSRAVNDRRNEALTLDNIGAIYEALGERRKALDYHTQALPLYRAVNDREGEANTLNNIGLVYADLGEKQRALDYYAQALPIFRAAHKRDGEAVTLFNIGSAHSSLGEKQKALDYYTQALPLFRTVGDRGHEASTLNNIGQVYYEIGETEKSLDYFAQALSLKQAIGDRAGEAEILNNIGAAYDELGEPQRALDYYSQALPLRRAVGDRQGEATTLSNLGMVYRALGDSRKALDYFSQALLLYRDVGDRDGEAITLDNIGDSYDALGDKQKALDYYEQALSLLRAVGDRAIEAAVLGNIALIERDTGNLAGARGKVEAAIAIIESLRTKIINQELRASYFATVQGYYEFYIDLLMRLHKQNPNEGHNAEALQVSERARARSLLEILAEANADIRQGVDSKLVERERALQQQLNVRAQEQTRVLAGSHSEEQATAIAREIEALTNEFQQLETKIRQTSPHYAALTQPQPLSAGQIQQLLDKDTILLEYSLGDERSYLWAVSQSAIASYELPKRDEIETLARQVYALLNSPKQWSGEALEELRSREEPTAKKEERKRIPQAKSSEAPTLESPEAATRLSEMLLGGPVPAQLRNKRLLIVGDGVLQYIPFAALPAPVDSGSLTVRGKSYHPLILDHEIVSLPSASTLAVLRQEVRDRKLAEKTVAVLADPVFENDDERVTKAKASATIDATDKVAGAKARELPLGMERAITDIGLKEEGLRIPRLPGTRNEAKQILSLVPAPQAKLALDFNASRQTAISPDLSQYRYVHFATHGFLDSAHPELSGIVLSMIDEKGNPQDGFLRAHEIFNLKLPAELVVLSACQTGLGKEVRGEGLVGLTRGFMYAGAPRVVVSLWSVNDQATAELMARFYRGMLKDKLRPAAALRAAQISLMKEKQWQPPFFWAAFTLQGEWR